MSDAAFDTWAAARRRQRPQPEPEPPRVAFIRARHADDDRDAHEDHALACSIRDSDGYETDPWEKRTADWRNRCDCRVRSRLLRNLVSQRLLNDLLPALIAADGLIWGEWGSSDDLEEGLLDLLTLPFYDDPACRYEWVAPVDRRAEKCPHLHAYKAARRGMPESNYCPDCSSTWPLVPIRPDTGDGRSLHCVCGTKTPDASFCCGVPYCDNCITTHICDEEASDGDH